MAPRKAVERPPAGLDAYWTKTWDHALAVQKEQGTWAAKLKPLLDEYVLALRESKIAREIAERDPYITTNQGLLHPHPGFAQANTAARRAMQLAEQLVLTPKAQAALVEDDDDFDDGDQAGL